MKVRGHFVADFRCDAHQVELCGVRVARAKSQALSAVRDRAKADRQALIAEAETLASEAMERGAPSQVKAIQAKWQEQAKVLPLAQGDERALWEQFRAGCDAVFSARQTKRKEEHSRKHEHRRAL